MEFQHADIVIVGAGLVGTSLAVALRGLGFRVLILEKNLPQSVTQTAVSTRPISLAYGSQVILQTMGVWPLLAAAATPISKVHVSQQGRFGSTHFSAEALQLPALGYVLPYASLAQQLLALASDSPGVDIVPIQTLDVLESRSEYAEVVFTTDSGRQCYRCGLVVAADGARSRSRQLLNIRSDEYDVGEVALTAVLTLKSSHQQVAYQRFTAQGVLAVLPLANPLQARLVWTMTQSQYQAVEQWSASCLSQQVQALFAKHILIANVERQQHYPLRSEWAEQQWRDHCVLIGNAAHTLYPLAAQGFNLGLRDVAVLAELIAANQGKALGSRAMLQQYQRWRAPDQKRTVALTKGISYFFGLELPLLGAARSMGLLASDLIPPLKNQLARQTLGLHGRLPRLARGLALRGLHGASI